MQFHDSKDESAIGLAIVGFLAVVMAAIIGNVAGDVQPKAPIKNTHPDVSSPFLKEASPARETPKDKSSSPYPQPAP